MNSNCKGPDYCKDCPLMELDTDEFTDGDRLDAVNSVTLLKSQFERRDTRFDSSETSRLESHARILVGYKNERVSKVAVRALERQVTGICNK
jgi:hypothetical protein